MNKKFLKLAAEIALKSGCVRSKRGAVLVKNNKVLVKTYNIPFPENQFCQKRGCLRDKLGLGMGKELEKCRAVHAEAKAVSLAAKKGLATKGATAYVTCMPCMNCAKVMLVAGIKEIYFLDDHADKTSVVFLEKMGVKCQRVKLESDDVKMRLRDERGQ